MRDNMRSPLQKNTQKRLHSSLARPRPVGSSYIGVQWLLQAYMSTGCKVAALCKNRHACHKCRSRCSYHALAKCQERGVPLPCLNTVDCCQCQRLESSSLLKFREEKGAQTQTFWSSLRCTSRTLVYDLRAERTLSLMNLVSPDSLPLWFVVCDSARDEGKRLFSSP